MKHSEFKRHLSDRLDIQESEVRRLLRANRKILKNLVNKGNGFSIPKLGLFKKHQTFQQKEYSHYHGYELLTKLKKILLFYPESLVKKKVFGTIITDSDISHLLTKSTGISAKLTKRFVNETAAIIKEGLERDQRIFVSGVGLFKASLRKNNDKVRDMRRGENVIYFKADAGLRNNILQSTDPVYTQHFPESSKNETPANQSNEFKTIRQSISTLHDTISVLSASQAPAAIETTSKQSIPVFNPVSSQLERKPNLNASPSTGSSQKPAIVIPIKRASASGNNGVTPPSETTYLKADNKTKLTRETFQNKNNEKPHKEKHPYFEWVVISLFLIILASGLYLIKPSVAPQNEFSSPPFEFTQIPEKKIVKTPEKLPITQASSKVESSSKQNTETTKPTPASTRHYLTVTQDTLWKISEVNYGSPFFWPVVYYHNIDNLTDPDTLEVDVELVLPSFNSRFETLSTAEKQIVSKSYYQVYLIYSQLGRVDAENYLTVSKNL